MTTATKPIKTPLAIAAAAAITLASLGSAMAADPTPLRGAIGGGKSIYVALRGGLTYGDATQFTVGAAGVNAVRTDYDMGGLVAGAVGMRFGSLRGEIELSYARFGVDTHTSIPAGGTSAAPVQFSEADSLGDASAINAMVSAYYDFDMGRISPFIGGGVGIGQLRIDEYGVASLAAATSGAVPGGIVLDDQDIGLAYHATVGAAFAVSDNIELEVAYRYQGIESEVTAISGAETEIELTSNNVFAGVRVGF